MKHMLLPVAALAVVGLFAAQSASAGPLCGDCSPEARASHRGAETTGPPNGACSDSYDESHGRPGPPGHGGGPPDHGGGPPGHGGGPPDHGGGPPDPGGFIERNAARLGLGPEEVAAIRAVVERSRARNETLLVEIDKAQDEMRELLHGDDPNEDAVLGQADRIGALHTEESKNRLRAIIAIRKMLTAEQRRELDAIRREMREKWGHGPPP
jgi:Spy/CpxP family protein refolding chaperone